MAFRIRADQWLEWTMNSKVGAPAQGTRPNTSTDGQTIGTVAVARLRLRARRLTITW